MIFHLSRCQHAIWSYASLMCLLLTAPIFSSCEKMRDIVAPIQGTANEVCTDGTRVLNVGFYAYFAPVSYSANGDPNADGFNTHQGYEADLLTALEAMKGVGLSFSRTAIPEWPGIWLKSAESAYDMIGGGITILDSRTKGAAGTPRVIFTSGHVKFRQSLLVRAEDAERLATHAVLTSDVRVGVLAGTTGEARLLELTEIADANGILAARTRIETPQGTVIADGTADYKITAAEVSPNLVGRTRLSPPSENIPTVIYLGDELGESELLAALAEGSIDAIARGEIGNQNATHASGAAFVVTALDEKVEYGGFTFALENAELAVCVDEKINYLTDNRNIGYAEWLRDPSVFMNRAAMWSAARQQ